MVRLVNIVVRVVRLDTNETVAQTTIPELETGEHRILSFLIPKDVVETAGVKVIAEFTDEFGNAYPPVNHVASWVLSEKPIHVKPMKSSVDTVAYVGNPFEVSVTVINTSNEILENITITDSLPNGNVELVEGELSKTFKGLMPGDSVTLKYKVKFLKPGTYILPPAAVSYRIYLTDSEYNTETNPLRVVVV